MEGENAKHHATKLVNEFDKTEAKDNRVKREGKKKRICKRNKKIEYIFPD